MGKRSIGLYEGIALYIAAILGSGVLFISSVTASIAGPASILSWIIVIFAQPINFPSLITFPMHKYRVTSKFNVITI